MRIATIDSDIRAGSSGVAMDSYGRKLFAIAAAFNFVVAATLMFLSGGLFPLLGLDPVAGANLTLPCVAAALVASYGYAYACVAYDARKYRVYIPLGVIGKLMVVAAVCALWRSGDVSWRIPGFASADLIFAILFLDYLRRTRGV
jgi:hypothetical protein